MSEQMTPVINDTQVKLINELCDYVEANVAPENFDMGNYRSVFINNEYSATAINLLACGTVDPNICGTAGCMLGYAPQCHPELHKDAESWNDVSDVYLDDSVCLYINLWGFMFGPSWRGYQNTPKGSVERIRLALEFNSELTNYQWSDANQVEDITTEGLRVVLERLASANKT